MKTLEYYDELLTRSACRSKRNFRSVIRKLIADKDFYVLLHNALIDFNIDSIDESLLANFFDNYTRIPITGRSALDLGDAIFDQMKKFFFPRLLSASKFSFTPSEAHLNIIPYDIFYKEHLPRNRLNVSKDEFYDDYKFYEPLLRKPTRIRPPYRASEGDRRNVWLAKIAEVDRIVASHRGNRAEAINDINGLGFEDTSRFDNETLLIQATFPASFSNICYKPTFIDGPLGGETFRKALFLNSKKVENGYGRTRSTNRGKYEVCECITSAVDKITSDFKFEFLGYTSSSIDKSNMKRAVVKRYKET